MRQLSADIGKTSECHIPPFAVGCPVVFNLSCFGKREGSERVEVKMMKAKMNGRRWRPLVGVIAIGALAFGLSLRLEGAPAPGAGNAKDKIPVAGPAMGLTDANAPANNGRPENGTETVTFGNLANLTKGDIKIMPTIVVDYRDDDATRMREAGLLVGPLPLPTGGVASGCNFAIQCDDGNRCTTDACNFPPGQPPLSGTCVHTPVDGGTNGSFAAPECTANYGLLCGGCDDGLFCNGLETCQAGGGGGCTPGTPPCVNPQVCSPTLKLCQPGPCSMQKKCIGGSTPGANCTTTCPGAGGRCAFTDCDDLKHCNGDEICDGGVCKAAENPCGSGAWCGEKKCAPTGNPAIDRAMPPSCTTTNDCIIEAGSSTCTTEGPVCLEGRCCTNNASEPTCERQKISACTGLFYGGDQGKLGVGDTQTSCTGIVINQVEVTCPKYSSGVAPYGTITQILGPVSDSTQNVAPFGAPLNKLGDDYKLSNDTNPDSYFKLDYLRFVGGSIAPERISFEIYDKNQNFIEDLFFISTSAFGIYPVQFQPPLTIPSEGFVVMRNASAFSPSAKHAWAVTNAVDVGSNDNTKLWINSGPMTVASTLGVLAFELQGTKTTPPGGACCNDTTGVCENAKIPWVCKAQGNNYLGDGTLCAACDNGPSVGQYCRRCSGGTNPACNDDAFCASQSAGTCVTTDSACDQTGGPNFCVAEAACGVGACCIASTGECNVISKPACETPPTCTTLVCTGGKVGAACATAADCNPTCLGSACVGGARATLICASAADCSTLGTFNGFGTDCDADNGHDEGKQHCCPQPLPYGGSDNCETAFMHVITVPPQGQVKVITITGNNSTATSTTGAPDSCYQPSTDPNADPGWWEAFTLVDNCSLVRIDHCCTDPVHRPAYRVLYNSCPCGPAIFDAVNPYKPGEGSVARGAPYCLDDDNLWDTYGLLPAGSYYYPVYSALAGHHGVYQMHISVEACPKAACCISSHCVGNSQNPATGGQCLVDADCKACYNATNNGAACTSNAQCTGAGALCDTTATCTPGSCVDGINQLQCNAQGGYFLAQPQKYPAVGACSGDICGTGSCCTGPGACFNEIAEQRVTPTLCDASGGNYVGGVTCMGGHCSGHPITSCAVDTDCDIVGGPCVGDPQTLSQPLPCPLCEFESIGTCQKFDDTLNFAVSDTNLGDGMVVADDFIPSGQKLEKVCVWGFYLDGDPNAVNPDCGPSVSADHFRVRVYTNDTAGNGRMPKTLLGTSVATSQRGILSGITRVKSVLLANVYAYTLTLTTPITGMVPGATYWLEIANDATISGPPKCLWYWSQKLQTSSAYSFGGSSAGYEPGFEQPFDLVFCTQFGLSPSEVGPLVGACCFCNGTCQQKTLADCDNATGIWHIETANCGSVTCPTGPPANDSCANSPITLPDVGSYFYEDQCATTDGYGPIPNQGFADSQIDFDVWYKYVTPTACNLRVDMCPTGLRFDSMFAVYHNPSNPTVCPPCPLMIGKFCMGGTNHAASCTVDANCPGGACKDGPAISAATLGGMGQDETCTGQAVGGPGFWVALEQIGRLSVPGECFIFRMGSFPGARGRGTFIVSGCGVQPTLPSTPLADSTAINKTRFISFAVPPSSTATAAAGDTALKVTVTSMHHVGYCIGGANDGLWCGPTPTSPPPVACTGGICSGYTGAPSVPFTVLDGKVQYVGAPTMYTESDSDLTRFVGATLQCAPYYRNWNSFKSCSVTAQLCAVDGDCPGVETCSIVYKGTCTGNPAKACSVDADCTAQGTTGPCLPPVIHVTGEAIVPSSTYKVENQSVSLALSTPPLVIKTTRWGDVETPYSPPAPMPQPAFGDISALKNKFASFTGAPIKARALLSGDLEGQRGLIDIKPALNFSDISLAVDAFTGKQYPYKPGFCTNAPATACAVATDCAGATGPCILCP